VIIGNIKEIIREWEESEKSINLPNEIGQQLLDILVLADLDPDAAFARLKAECLNPENVESFLNSNGANLVSLSDFVPMERKEKFKVKFDLEGKDSDFTANLQACARIVWNNPRLRRKFEEILNLFGRRCDFTVSGATIYKYGYFEESEPRSKRARIES
jgi:hypothetical protein